MDYCFPARLELVKLLWLVLYLVKEGVVVIELNASADRNAASIRSAATHGSQHISLDSFVNGGNSNSKTLILLDEETIWAEVLLEFPMRGLSPLWSHRKIPPF